MKVLIVYCHPSADSFTHAVKDAFISGLADAGHTWEISDLYAMGFDPVYSSKQYGRDANYLSEGTAADDILAEQTKLDSADATVFIYPVFWTEAPAMLVGWFQRVWSYGYAYGPDRTMKRLDRALFLVTMGGSLSDPVRAEQAAAMRTVMLGDRVHDRAVSAEMVIFDEMTHGYGNDGNRAERAGRFLAEARRLGREL